MSVSVSPTNHVEALRALKTWFVSATLIAALSLLEPLPADEST
jgi:hypothetical protein